jgi:cysteinyl-tRNA synthetase
LVRHHDYTLAVAEAVSGKQFSRYWLHGGHLLVEGKKMSKSKGNVYYPKDFLTKGASGGQLRFFLIYGPYRKKLNYSLEKFAQATEKLNSFRRMISGLEETKSTSKTEKQDTLTSSIVSDFENHMNNDLDVKSAFDSLYETTVELYEMKQSLNSEEIKNVLNCIRRIDSVLQCIF